MTALVVGLGNPGPDYAHTRHNIGFMVVDQLASRAGVAFSLDKRSRALVARVRYGVGAHVVDAILAKPQSFMNLSGGPTSTLASYFKVAPDQVMVVHDELDLPFGVVRLKRGGGSAGHNGLKDITKALGTPEYVRVRAGIGRPPGGRDAADHVLRAFSAAERKEVDFLVADAADAVEAVLADGFTAAQQRLHSP